MNDYNDDDFETVIQGYDQAPYQPGPVDPQPYGIPTGSIPAKPGLTKRGKTALAVGAVILAGGGLISWQHYSAVSAANDVKAQEFQIEKAKLDLEMMREMNRANTATTKTKESQEQERTKQISACVNASKPLIGKQLGVTYPSVLKDCRDQYPATTDSADMQNAAASKDTNGAGSGVNSGLLIGAAVLAGGVVLVARKRPSSTPA